MFTRPILTPADGRLAWLACALTCTLLSGALCLASAHAHSNDTMPAPSLAASPAAAAAAVDIVLVHGAFADGSSWLPVIALLQQRGYRVTAVQNPLRSLDDDVQATLQVIARQPGRVLLVGHSWGGAVITQAGNDARVRGLVYLSALVPDSGESVSDLLSRLQAPMTGLTPDAQGLLWLDQPERYARLMAADLPPDAAHQLAAVQQPIHARAFGDKIPHAAWHDKPSWYLVTDGDQALPTEVQRRLASQIRARTTVIAASHMSMQSQPQAVAALIAQAAARLALP